MKKVVKFLLVFALIIPFVVKADMGAPMLRPYEAIVIKEGGIKSYDYATMKEKGTFKKDQILNVTYEIVQDGVKYLAVEDADGNSYYVKAEDVVAKEEEVKVSDSWVSKEDSAIAVKVYANEVTVRKGPSIAYKEIGKIKKGDTGSYKYYVHDSTYIYYESDSISGWVNYEENDEDAVLLKKWNDFIVTKPIKLSCGTVPTGTILKDIWVANVDFMRRALVEYNGCSQMVNALKSEELSYLGEPEVYTFSVDTKVYNDTQNQTKALIDIPKGERVIILARTPDYVDENHSFYVIYKGVKGWTSKIAYNNLSEVEGGLNESEKESLKEQEIEIEKPEEKKEEEKKEDKKEDKKESNGFDTMTIILICVIAGLTIALTATITIILVNKKK